MAKRRRASAKLSRGASATKAVELAFRLGLVGSPILPTECGDGCPSLWNAQIRESGSLAGKPGFWRTFMTRLDTLVVGESRDNGKRLVVFHALDAYGVPGSGFAVIDYTRASATGVRVLALGVNENIDPLTLGLAANETVRAVDYGGLSAAIQGGFPKLYQMRAHEYPRIHTMGDRTIVLDQWSQAISVQNGVARRAGLKPPARKPVLRSAVNTQATIDECNAIHATNPSTGWTPAMNSAVTLTVATSGRDADGNYTYAPFYNPDSDGGTPGYPYIQAEVRVQGSAIFSTPVFITGGGIAGTSPVISSISSQLQGQRFTVLFTAPATYTITGGIQGAFTLYGGTYNADGTTYVFNEFSISITAGGPYAAGDKWVFSSGVIAMRNITAPFASIPVVSPLRWSGDGPNNSRKGAAVLHSFGVPNGAQEETWEGECVRLTQHFGAEFVIKGTVSGQGPFGYECRDSGSQSRPTDEAWPRGAVYDSTSGSSVFDVNVADFLNFPQFAFKRWTGSAGGGWAKVGDKFAFDVYPSVGRLRMGFMLKADDDKPGAILPGGSVEIIMATGVALDDDAPVVVPIDINIQAGEWYILDYPITLMGVTFSSIGLRVSKPVPGDLFRGGSYTVCFDHIERVIPHRGPFKGPWASRFTWANPALPGRVESDPSPPSDFLQCGITGIAVELASAGFRGYYGLEAAGVIDTADDQRGANYTTEAKNYKVYMTQSAFDEGPEGGSFWRLAGPTEGVIPQTAPTAAPVGLSDLSPVIIGDGLTGEIADIVLHKDLRDFENAETLFPYRGQIPACKASIVDRDRIIMCGQDDYSAGIGVDVRKYYDVAHLRTVGNVTFSGAGLNDIIVGGDYTGLTNAVLEVEVETTAGSPDTFKWRIDGGAYTTGVAMSTSWTTLTAGVKVKWAAVDGHTIGNEWTFDAVFARWSPAMVLRRMRIYSTDTDEYPNSIQTQAKTYLIEGWIDEFNVIIGNRRQVLTLRDAEHYNGATSSVAATPNRAFAYTIIGEKNKFWYTAKTAFYGTDPESVPLSNFVDINMPNDELVGVAHAGEYVIFFGKNGAYRTIENRGAVDGGGEVYPKPEPMSGAPGLGGARMLTELPGNQIFGMSPDWRFFKGDAGAIGFYEGKGADATEFPITSRISGWIKTNVEADGFRYSWMVHDAARNWVVLVFVKDDGAASATPYRDGAAYDFTLPATDFYYALVVDLTQGIILPWDKVRLTCPLLVTQGQPEEGTRPSKIFAGDMYGYIYELNKSTARGNGIPSFTLRAVATVRTSDYVLTCGAAAFPTDGDGLKDLWATIVGATTVTRRISSNTATALTFYPADGVLPSDAATAVVHLGQINIEADFKEFQFDYKAHIAWLLFKTYKGSTSLPTQIQANIFTNDTTGRNRYVDRSAAATSRILTEDIFEEADGKAWFERIPARAIQAQIGWAVQEGEVNAQGIGDSEVQGLMAGITVQSADSFRGGM